MCVAFWRVTWKRLFHKLLILSYSVEITYSLYSEKSQKRAFFLFDHFLGHDFLRTLLWEVIEWNWITDGTSEMTISSFRSTFCWLQVSVTMSFKPQPVFYAFSWNSAALPKVSNSCSIHLAHELWYQTKSQLITWDITSDSIAPGSMNQPCGPMITSNFFSKLLLPNLLN